MRLAIVNSSFHSIRPSSAIKPLAFTIRRMATSPPKVNVSSNSDPSELHSLLAPLTTQGGRWQISATNSGIEREFKFKSFKKTWEFMNKVAEQAQKNKHHPEWSNVYNTTFVRWTTHHPAGLSMLDCEMATFCDQAAAMLGEVVSDGPQEVNKTEATMTEETKPENAGMCGLTDRVVKAGEDCCVPKSKSSQKTAEAQQERTCRVEGEELHEKGP